VDNGSTDGSPALVKALAVPSRLIRSPRNGGYGAGANLGACASDREFLFICNPDLVAEPGAIRCLAEALDARPDAAVAGPMLLETDGSVYPSGRTFPILATPSGMALSVCSGGTIPGRAGIACSATPSTGLAMLTGCREPAFSCDGKPSRRSAASTSPTSCTSKTSTSVGGCGAPVGACSMSPRHASCTSRGVRPRAAPTGCSLPTTGRSSGLPAAPARAANGSCCLS